MVKSYPSELQNKKKAASFRNLERRVRHWELRASYESSSFANLIFHFLQALHIACAIPRYPCYLCDLCVGLKYVY